MKTARSYIGIIVKLIIFTLFSIIIRGYQYGSGNQVHYFNFAFKKFYPGLYPNDYLFKTHDLPYTIFVDFIYIVLKIFGENTFIFFFIYFFFLFLFYLAIYLIFDFFFKNRKVSAIILLFFIFPIPIGESTINTLEMSLMPRFIAEIFLLLSIYFILIKKNVLSPIFAGIGFLFHPITLIPYIPIVILNKTFLIKSSWKPIVMNLVIFILIASPILFKFVFYGQNGSLFIDQQWRNVLYERTPYIFIWRWSAINFLALLSICIFFVSYKFIFGRKINATVNATIITSLILFIAAFLSALFNFRLGLQLQLARNLYLLVVFVIIYGVGSFLTKLSGFSLNKIAVLILTISVILCFPKRIQYGVLWINPPTDYQKAAIWAKNNTPNDSLFLVPLDAFGFRFWSKRSVFLEHKEGGDGLYVRSFAIIWNKRKELIENNKLFSKDYLKKLKKDYKIDYVVTTQQIPELVVYKNKKYTIYKI